MRAVDVRLDERGRAGVPAGRARVGAGAAESTSGWLRTGRTRSATRWPPRRSPSSSACRCRRSRTALAEARPRRRWRMEVTERADGVMVVNDAYNANPESMAAALRRAADDGARAAVAGRCSARWASSGDGAAGARTGGSAGSAARLGVDRLVGRSAPDAAGVARRRRGVAEPGVGRRGAGARAGRGRRAARCCGPSCGRATWCWSRRPGPPAWSGSPLAARRADQGGRGRPVRSILVAALVSLLVSILCTPHRDPGLPPAGLRAGDPRRRPAVAPGQAGHAHHGRHRDHHRDAGRLLRRRTWSPADRGPDARPGCCCST